MDENSESHVEEEILRSIEEDAVRAVNRWLSRIPETESMEDRREQLAGAVRMLTRLWSEMNPDFDGDAWYPVSAMLIGHWEQIVAHQAQAEPGGDG